MIRVRNIALSFMHPDEDISRALCRRLGVNRHELIDWSIAKKSIDARKKKRILFIYTVDAQLRNESAVLERFANDTLVSERPDQTYLMPESPGGCTPSPVVVGSGPCGLMAALLLAQVGMKPILIERGKPVAQRAKDVQAFWKTGLLDPESNVQFGEGGAGTFSDGKLTTQTKDRHHRARKVFEEFVAAGAPPEIFYQASPHIGTDHLIRVVRNVREKIIELGGQVRFETKLTGLEIDGGAVRGAIVNDGEVIPTRAIVLAVGHSARDTFSMLEQNQLAMEAKPFSIGVRIEHRQSLIDVAQFGSCGGDPRLGAAEYRLVHHADNGRSAYTFCMCPGGEVIASASEPGHLVTNGMSRYARDADNANSALLVGVTPADFPDASPLAGVAFQRIWEQRAFEAGGSNYYAPVQQVGDFLNGRPSTTVGKVAASYTPGVTPADLVDCLPEFVTDTLRQAIPAMGRKLKGFAQPEAILTALESRSSSPVRLLRDGATLQSTSLAGLYPAGEGAGYAGGIVSAAVDGLNVAQSIIAQLA